MDLRKIVNNYKILVPLTAAIFILPGCMVSSQKFKTLESDFQSTTQENERLEKVIETSEAQITSYRAELKSAQTELATYQSENQELKKRKSYDSFPLENAEGESIGELKIGKGCQDLFKKVETLWQENQIGMVYTLPNQKHNSLISWYLDVAELDKNKSEATTITKEEIGIAHLEQMEIFRGKNNGSQSKTPIETLSYSP